MKHPSNSDYVSEKKPLSGSWSLSIKTHEKNRKRSAEQEHTALLNLYNKAISSLNDPFDRNEVKRDFENYIQLHEKVKKVHAMKFKNWWQNCKREEKKRLFPMAKYNQLKVDIDIHYNKVTSKIKYFKQKLMPYINE